MAAPRRVLVLGANGFIGSHAAAALAEAGWEVRAGARSPGAAARRAPSHQWVEADFRRLTRAADWESLLDGVDAVVNCVGVLQDGGDDSTDIAHVVGPRALIAACEAQGVTRLVHLSAVGAEETAGTAYARTKQQTELALEASALEWLILRPSLVVARPVFGGTGLIRALAAFPLAMPVIGGAQRFRPVAMDDLCAAIVAALGEGAPSRERLDVAGPECLSQDELLRLYRGWLGLKPAPIVHIPTFLAVPVLSLGDLAGRLGWPSPLRTTALRQMNHDVEGDPDLWVERLCVRPQTLARHLSRHPASVQDVWHARLWFVRPIAIVALSLFWTLSGLITLGAGWERSLAVLAEGGLHGRAGVLVAGGGAVVDIALGLSLLVRPWTARAAMGMIAVTLTYLLAGTVLLPHYWLDPLGPWLKVVPGMVVCLFVAATEARR